MGRGLYMRFEDAGFMSRLRLFYRNTRMSSADILRSQARLLARDLAFQTQPFGKSRSSRLLGENAVSKEIRRVYKAAGELGMSTRLAYSIRNSPGTFSGLGRAENPTQNPDQAGRAFVWLVSKGKYGEARELLRRVGVAEEEITTIPIGKMDGGEEHQKARHGPRKKVSRNQWPRRIVADKQIKTYIRKIQRNVGIVKAGWAAGAKMLRGTRGIPQWVTRNIGRALGGTVIDQSNNPSRPTITLINNVPWIDKNLTEAQKDRAVKVQYQKMLEAIDKALRAEARSAKLA